MTGKEGALGRVQVGLELEVPLMLSCETGIGVIHGEEYNPAA